MSHKIYPEFPYPPNPQLTPPIRQLLEYLTEGKYVVKIITNNSTLVVDSFEIICAEFIKITSNGSVILVHYTNIQLILNERS
jgi:hypothetical protein